MAPSSFLLRTMAAVAPGTRVVDVACGDGVQAEALARLGFDVHASAATPDEVDAARARLADVHGADEAARRVTRARPDATGHDDASAPWVLASRPTADVPLAAVFAEARRVLAPGGWLFSEVDGAGPDAHALPLAERLDADKQAAAALARAAIAADLAVASLPTPDAARGTVAVIFRRVDAATVG